MKHTICPVCESQQTSECRTIFDDRYGQPDLFKLVKCAQCGHQMTSPRLAEAELGALYSTYYPRKQVEVDEIRREAARVKEPFAGFRRWWTGTDNQGQYLVRPGELMLDVGCGSGLSLLEASALGAQVRGVEADPNVRRIADETGLNIHIGSLLDDPFPDEAFDLVVLNQVIEHVPAPDEMLRRIHNRLKPGARVVLVFPNVRSFWCRMSGERWINWHVPYHLHHFCRQGFVQMALRCGYRIKSTRTITPNLWTILQFRANRMHVERGAPSSLWTVSAPAQEPAPQMPTVKRRTLRRVLRRVALVGLMLPLALVNRTIDALGWGDSLMIEIIPAKQS